MDAPPAIPDDQIEALLLVAEVAHERALAGDVAEGYEILLLGFQRARLLAEETREPWLRDVIIRWRSALDRYAERWNVGRG